MADRNKGPRIIDLVSDYVVVDLETTSKYVNYAEIIEIGALKVVNNEPVDSFSTLVRPDFDIPRSATEINNITNEMVADVKYADLTRHSVLDAKDFSEDRRKSTSELSLSRQRLNSLKYEPLFQLDIRVSGIKMAYEKLQNALKKAQRDNYSYTQGKKG